MKSLNIIALAVLGSLSASAAADLSEVKVSSDLTEQRVSNPLTTKRVAYGYAQKNSVSGQEASELDDPYYSQQNYLFSSDAYINGSNLQPAAEYLDTKFEGGGETVRVLVIDGSFYANDELPYVEGYSFADTAEGSSRPEFIASEPAGSCSDEHGTGVASVYGAIRNNGSLIAGAAPNIEVVAAEALICDEGRLTDVIDSMLWGMGETVDDATITNPVDIINLSLGYTSDTCTPAIQNVLDMAKDRGIQVYASAGNDGEAASQNSPSNCENIIVAGSLNSGTDTIAGYSNYGDSVDIYTQGEDILGLDGNEGVVVAWGGTSFATPLVGATGVLLKSYFPDVTPAQAEWFIKNGSRPMSVDPICDSMACDKGQLDALATVQRAYAYFEENTTSIKPVLNAGEECFSTNIALKFATSARLCELYEVSFEDSVWRENVTFELHATPVQGGESTTILRTDEVSIVTDEIDLDAFNYHYSICFDGECEESPLTFQIDNSTPQECL